MTIDGLSKETSGMNESQITQLVAFARFLKYYSQSWNDYAEDYPFLSTTEILLQKLLKQGKTNGKLMSKDLDLLNTLSLDFETQDRFYHALEDASVDIDYSDFMSDLDDFVQLKSIEFLYNSGDVSDDVEDKRRVHIMSLKNHLQIMILLSSI